MSMDAFSPHSMLYQTHPPLFFQFHPLPSSISDLTASSSSSSSSSTSSSLISVSSHLPVHQAETEMECVEAALKSSFKKDMAVKLNPQCSLEDLNAYKAQNVVPSDDFFVDELLDFSHMEEEEQQHQQEETEQHHEGDQTHETCDITSLYSAKHDVESVPSSELTVPAEDDDLANLEWLSHFVEDSFSEYSAAYPAGAAFTAKTQPGEKGPDPETPGLCLSHPCFATPVPAKARSKRTRTSVRVWSLASPSFTESSSSSTSSSSSSSPTSPWLIYTNAGLDQVCSGAKPPAKKPKKTPAAEATPASPRRCTHCGVHKTPQWRTGPLGAKTLCNACGVRFKSGRLLPEYRPACSPTFSSELHSNHHRKVLEMRRKKEGPDGVESGLGIDPAPTPTPAVPSF